MRISLVITELDPGGAERNLVKLAIGLAGYEHEITVISLSPAPANSILHDKLTIAGISVVYLGCRSNFSLPIAIAKLRSTLRRLRPDIIQSFLYHANLLTSICNRNSAHFIGLRVKDPRRWRYRLLARFASRWSGAICVSRDVESYVVPFLQGKSTRIMSIGNGVEIEAVKAAGSREWPRDLPRAEEPLVFIGRLDKQKGLDTLLDAAPNLLDSFPQRALYIIGDGPIKREVESVVKTLESRSRIHITGYRDDAVAILSKAKLFLFPSRWEGMPNVVMEAMTLGIPVCSTPVDGIVELLGEPSRQIYPRKDWGAAAAQMLLWPLETLHELGRFNSEVISARFSVGGMVHRYLEAYGLEQDDV